MSRLPNIVLITADQMRADQLGAVDPTVITPHLDALAARGVLAERAYCVNPVCTPSRAAILTGRYPHCTGAWNIGVSVNEDEVTLPDHLRPLGYRSVANGKMHFRPQCRRDRWAFTDDLAEDPAVRDRPRATDGTYYGFDEVHNTEDNRVGEYQDWLRQVAPEWAANPLGVVDRDWPRTVREGSCLPPELHQTTWIGDHSLRTIEQHDAARPLFMWTSFVDPHHPFNAPRKYVERYAGRTFRAPIERAGQYADRPEHLRLQGERGYWPGGGEAHELSPEEVQDHLRNAAAMVTFIDEQVGRLVDALRERDMLEDTIFVFTADHGELLGDHHLLHKGPWLIEGLMRVPMILAGPGLPTGLRSQALMENADVLPTLLELLGQTVPYGVQGRSQVPAWRDGAPVRDSAICSYDVHDRGIHAKALRTDRHKLVVFAGESYGELYDLQADPGELHNRFADPACATVRAELFERFTHRLIQDQDPLPERRAFW